MTKHKTPSLYTKLPVAFLLGVILLVGAGMRYQKTESVVDETQQAPQLRERNSELIAVEATQDPVMQTTGALQGYYDSEIRTSTYGDQYHVFTCEFFVVTDGDEGGRGLQEYFINRVVQQGNTIQRVSPKGELLLNLSSKNIDALDPLQAELLRNSSVQNPVIISVALLPPDLGMEVGPCHSFVEVSQVDDFYFD
ncbi:MAG: hypothetical protein RL150_129 [Candidatus Parcubacteria bacterium]|jgi:hypothetical protein